MKRKSITREVAYKKIIHSHVDTMRDDQMIEYCMQWVGIDKCDSDYKMLLDKLIDIHLNGDVEGFKLLIDLYSSAKLDELTSATDESLQTLLGNRYKITDNIEVKD